MPLTPEDLAQKIKDAQDRQPKLPSGDKKAPSGSGQAMRAATDLVAALVVGGFLGYWIDRWLGTKPWGMIIFFFFGFAAGFLNIYRAQTGQAFKIGFKDKE